MKVSDQLSMLHDSFSLDKNNLVFILYVAGIAILAIALIALIFLAIRAIRRRRLRRAAEQRLGFSIPKEMKLQKSNVFYPFASFTLGRHAWNRANNNRTRDKRTNDFSTVVVPSILGVAEYELSHDDVFFMYDFVARLRMRGIYIMPCPEEQRKMWREQKSFNVKYCAQTPADIVGEFKAHPTRFEEFCAELFQREGFRVEVTSATGDGGFDLKIIRPDGFLYIAECKCYEVSSKVGRPAIQKLVGANAAERANGMIFITTSSYSSQAISFAAEAGVLLIDGAQLIQFRRRVWGDVLPRGVPAFLTHDELLAHYPPDMAEERKAIYIHVLKRLLR